MTISSNLINILSKQSLEHKEIQNWTDFKLYKLGTKYLCFAQLWEPLLGEKGMYTVESQVLLN